MNRQTWATVVLLVVGTVLIAATGLDIRLERYFYDRCGCWTGADVGFWRWLYLYGPVPGYLVAAGSLLMVSVSYWRQDWGWWRRPALMMVFCIALGPGLLVNVAFKDNWGRPRPREVVGLGGDSAFLQPWQPGTRGQGKSFPCGHCAIAFYLALPFLFLRPKYPRVAWGLLAGGLLLGSLTGVARMMAGGHFLSDVLWSWGMVWGAGLAGMRLFRPDLPYIPAPSSRKRAVWATVLVGVLLPVLTALVLVASPYISQKQFVRSPDELAAYRVVAIDGLGNLRAVPGETLTVSYGVYAFGFPGSKVGFAWRASGDTLWGRFEKTGFFTELKNNITVQIPARSDLDYVFKTQNGTLEAAAELDSIRLHLEK